MSQKHINRGAIPNDGTGDTPYTYLGSIEDNFTELYGKLGIVLPVAETVDYSLSPADTGLIFTNEGANSEMNFALPLWQIGLTFRFHLGAQFYLNVICGGGEVIQFADLQSSNGGQIRSFVNGSSLHIAAAVANRWCVLSHEGTWTLV